jgi:hypothetical protein
MTQAAHGSVLLPLVLTGSSGHWSISEPPLPAQAVGGAGEIADLTAVACATAGRCSATGGYQAKDGGGPALIERESGPTWSGVTPPQPAGAATGAITEDDLQAIACPQTTACTAVGNYFTPNGGGSGLLAEGEILTYGSGTWSAVRAPLPAGIEAKDLSGVDLGSLACPSSSSCVAAGDYVAVRADGKGVSQGLLLRASGSHWSATNAPLPAGSGVTSIGSGGISAVSCAAAGSCAAIGSFDNLSGVTSGLIETLR